MTATAQRELIDAAASLLYAGIVASDADTLTAIASVPPEAWPDGDFAAVAAAMTAIAGRGQRIEVADLLRELAAMEAKNPTGIVTFISSHEATCTPRTRAQELCEAHARRVLSLRLSSVQRALIDGDDLGDVRHLLADSDFESLLPARADATTASDPHPSTEDEDLVAGDMRHALVLAQRWRGRWRYATHCGRWRRWTGKFWESADDAVILKAAADTLRRAYADGLKRASSREEIERCTTLAMQSGAVSRVRNALQFLAGFENITTGAAEWDADAWTLNTTGGILDLRDGTTHPHDPDGLCTKIATATPDTGTGAWQRHIERVLPNENVRREVQRSLGMALVGATLAERLDIWHGADGANGKSTTARALLTVLGEYGAKAPPDLLIDKKHGEHPTRLAELQGKRVLFSTEIDQGARLAESLVKELSGGDAITARFMHRDYFSFEPSHSLFLIVNHRPVVTGTDSGIWRRIKLIPWEVSIPPEERRPQDEMIRELVDDGDAVLQWMLDGLKDWQTEPSWTAPEVQAVTDAYRNESDRLAGFLADACETGPTRTVGVADLFTTYEAWCNGAGEQPLSKRRFGDGLRERGITQTRGKHARHWIGIRIAPDWSKT